MSNERERSRETADAADASASPEPGAPHVGIATDPEPAPSSEPDIERLRAEVKRLEESLEHARRESAENLDKARRTLADFENFRRRTRADAQSARDKAKVDLIAEFLGVLDNFDRAMEHAGDEESLYEGVKLIFRQFRGTLEKQGITRIDTEGHPFDPLVHEAVMREPTTHYKDGTIIKELERGYYLNGKVLRPAKVKVAVAPETPAGATSGEPPKDE